MEAGLHNDTLATLIASTIINNAAMAILERLINVCNLFSAQHTKTALLTSVQKPKVTTTIVKKIMILKNS
ncbi:MAG: hypothetical protein CMK65_07950 [Pseudoalteromonas sp.]|nr:hypothetical protein [Pseudoalteromonas sp.]